MTKNPSIAFDRLWRKLEPNNFVVGAKFSTARGYKPDKSAHYEDHAVYHDIFDIMVKEKAERKVGTARLLSVKYDWSSNLSTDFIKRDTFPDWERADFHDFLRKLYGISRVFLIILTFEVVAVTPPPVPLDAFGLTMEKATDDAGAQKTAPSA